MEFVIPAGSSANLPKELVAKVVKDAVEKSVCLKMVDQRGQLIELVNEGTIPVIGVEAMDKVYRIDTTADITTLDEQAFSIKSPDLAPVELGTYITLKDKQVKMYPALQLEELFISKLSSGMSRTAEKIITNGDTLAAGATNPLNIADGLVKIATNGNITPVNYTAETQAGICDAVAEGIGSLGVYGENEFSADLVLLASTSFEVAARKAASSLTLGYEIADYDVLGLKKVVFVQGIPVIRRMNITGDKALLTNIKGLFAAYYGDQMSVEAERISGKRATQYVLTYWFDLKWAFLDDTSGKAVGIVLIQKGS